MKLFFENPEIEVITFAVEDVITASGMRNGFGMNSGFDEAEPNEIGEELPNLMPPCL